LVLGAVDIIWIYLHWWAEDYVITNRRILKVEGLFNKRAADSSLEKINDAILEQSVFGRMFDWGDLKVLTAAEENADDYHLLHHAPTFKKTMLLAKQDIEDELARRITAPLEALNARESEQDRREAEAQASARPAAAPPVAAPAPVQKTAEEKLRELAALRDAGLITPEDFEAKKTTILATM
ncbi:MAG TPA: PH domain-containing protein, partial [Candidatus Limnocylindrales bacterium]